MSVEVRFGDPSIPGAVKLAEPRTIRLRVDTLNCFNGTIDHINRLSEIVDQAGEEVPFSVADISFRVILGYLEDIAKRTLELKDAKLIEYCEGLGMIKHVTGGENLQ